MSFDLYADLTLLEACPADSAMPFGLASGLVDGCTVWSTGGKDRRNQARQSYIRCAQKENLKFPPRLEVDQDGGEPPDPSWIRFEIAFLLETPWYSKDDRPFHVLDNPVRKDRVFGVPFMSEASWKGLLRWACRMSAGLAEHLHRNRGKLDGWKDPAWILHLFGNEKEEKKDFQRGALAFHPTWFSRIGFEVINPHSRKTRAGTQPIYYEVVPAGASGVFKMLYAPLPGSVERSNVKPFEAINGLLDAAQALFTTYGISAKRMAGWGTARVTQWKAKQRFKQPISKGSLAEFTEQFATWFNRA